MWHGIKPGDNQSLQGAAFEVVASEGTSVLHPLPHSRLLPFSCRRCLDHRGSGGSSTAPSKLLVRTAALLMGGGDLWMDGWAGLWGMHGPLSLHPVVGLLWGSPSLCLWPTFRTVQGKPVVDNLERRRQLAGLGTVMGEWRSG